VCVCDTLLSICRVVCVADDRLTCCAAQISQLRVRGEEARTRTAARAAATRACRCDRVERACECDHKRCACCGARRRELVFKGSGWGVTVCARVW
jgi:hypothetical protein